MMLYRLLFLLSIPVLFFSLYAKPVLADEMSQLEDLAKTGDKIAQYNLGVLYHTSKTIHRSDRTAMYWFTKAAEQGVTEAAFCLGILYEEGKGIKKPDFLAAEKWYQQAAEQGHTKAQYHLGLMLYEGYGVHKNPEQGVFWLQKAAEKGLSKAEYKLGYAYLEGKGVKLDKNMAKYWLQRAAHQGEKDAAILLNLMNSYSYNGNHKPHKRDHLSQLLATF